MKAICSLALLLSAMNVHSANILKELECHDKVVEHGIETLSLAREVNSLFGATSVDHFISNFGSTKHAPVWNSVTYFAGRYTFSLQVPISIDYENCRLRAAAGSPVMYINEATKIDISRSGIAGATLKGGIAQLDAAQWRKLVAHGGDWSVVNVPIVTNRPPLKDFDEYVRQQREPIRNRKEGFDNPIKEALQSLRDQQTNRLEVPENRKAPGNGSAGAQLNELDCHAKVVREGIETLILPADVNSLFGATNVDHFISGFGTRLQIPVWHSVVYFAGRYRFWLQVPILVDHQKCSFDGAINSAMVQIDEITSVDISKARIGGAKTKERWGLSQSEWEWLVKNKGDWSVVKVPIRTNAPVKGFEDYVRQERKRPLRERQEDFDRPIRKLIDALPYPSGGAIRN